MATRLNCRSGSRFPQELPRHTNPPAMSTRSTSAPGISPASSPASSPMRIICRRARNLTITCRRFTPPGRRTANGYSGDIAIPVTFFAGGKLAQDYEVGLGFSVERVCPPRGPPMRKTWSGSCCSPRKTTCSVSARQILLVPAPGADGRQTLGNDELIYCAPPFPSAAFFSRAGSRYWVTNSSYWVCTSGGNRHGCQRASVRGSFKIDDHRSCQMIPRRSW